MKKIKQGNGLLITGGGECGGQILSRCFNDLRQDLIFQVFEAFVIFSSWMWAVLVTCFASREINRGDGISLPQLG